MSSSDLMNVLSSQRTIDDHSSPSPDISDIAAGESKISDTILMPPPSTIIGKRKLPPSSDSSPPSKLPSLSSETHTLVGSSSSTGPKTSLLSSPSSELKVPSPSVELKTNVVSSPGAELRTNLSSYPSTEPTTSPAVSLALPSRRTKKSPHSRNFLIPADQLPIFPLPPPPDIEDPELLKQVFTHQSSFPKVRFRFEDPPDEPAGHYEKLEHVGDSILGMVVTCYLHEVKPRLTCGSATQLKAHLVSNSTLSHLSGLYNFPQRLTGHPELLPMLRVQTDTRAALMEAYIAAIYFSHPPSTRLVTALPIIDTWLREMYKPLVEFFYNHMCSEHEQHHSAFAADSTTGEIITMSRTELDRIDKLAMGMYGLVQLYANGQDRQFECDETRCESNLGRLWKVAVRIDGIELGEAMRVGKKAARNAACYEAAMKLGLAEKTSASR
ncbi:hypothetical protein BCR39DRAFT_517868 [Naematelia encephala]|uniref:RNase III domain-containing protein n=1 Tax=Naematelia encephala TaxID=71784 RepID=A0A1Y2BHT9_9TREE|nr:hypothetical protein BCR39DRAFT_517868 [Naematelia encephala]